MHKENRPGNQKAAGELDSDVGVVGDDGKQSLPTLNAFSQRRKKPRLQKKRKKIEQRVHITATLSVPRESNLVLMTNLSVVV